jgi:hypothetical protein
LALNGSFTVELYLYTAIVPFPLSAFAGEPMQQVRIHFIKSYTGLCLEGSIILLACVIFSFFASSPVVDASANVVTMV